MTNVDYPTVPHLPNPYTIVSAGVCPQSSLCIQTLSKQQDIMCNTNEYVTKYKIDVQIITWHIVICLTNINRSCVSLLAKMKKKINLTFL